MSLLQDLVARLEDIDIDSIEEPKAEVQESDTPVGVASDDVKQLFALRARLDDEHTECIKEQLGMIAEHLGDTAAPEGYDENERHHQAIHRERDLVNDLMWTQLRLDFPEIANKQVIGLRAGWQVVYSKPEVKVIGLNLSDLAKLFNLGETE